MLFELCARNVLDNGRTVTADVVLVNNLDKTNLQTRELAPDQALSNIFIGRNPKGVGVNNLIYIGDDKIHTDNVTVHLRFAKVQHPLSHETFYAPWVSIRVSGEISTAILEEAE